MDRFKLTRRVALLGMAANVLLTGIKLAAGFISGSQAMIADGFNSAQDIFASVITFIGNRIASRPEDKNHPYGHGKAEYVFSMIISFSLLIVGYQIFRGALSSLINREEFDFSWWLVVVAVFTIITKLSLFYYTRSAGRKEDNLLIVANAVDHRNDVFVTSATLLGIISGTRGIYWVDSVVGIGISIWIIITAFSIFSSAYNVLMDTNLDQHILGNIHEVIETINGVGCIDDVTAKPIGVGYIIIAKISVSGSMTVEESHSIAIQIKERIKDCSNCSRTEEVVVHITPE